MFPVWLLTWPMHSWPWTSLYNVPHEYDWYAGRKYLFLIPLLTPLASFVIALCYFYQAVIVPKNLNTCTTLYLCFESSCVSLLDNQHGSWVLLWVPKIVVYVLRLSLILTWSKHAWFVDTLLLLSSSSFGLLLYD